MIFQIKKKYSSASQVYFSTNFLQVLVLQVLLLRVCVLLVHVFPSPVQSAKNIICLTVDITTVARE